MNANDHVPMVNIMPFGFCKKGMPCMPLTPVAWVDVNKKHIIDGAPALTEDSKLACAHGGVITIVPLDAGSAEEGDRNENAEDSVESIAAEALDIAAGVFGIAASILSKGKIKPTGKKNIVNSRVGKTGASSNPVNSNYSSLPNNAKDAYTKYDKDGWNGKVSGQTSGTKAGGTYRNRDGKLPTTDASGNPITYKEYDVNNKVAGQSRDAERFVRGSDGSVYYTNDHYGSFIKIN